MTSSLKHKASVGLGPNGDRHSAKTAYWSLCFRDPGFPSTLGTVDPCESAQGGSEFDCLTWSDKRRSLSLHDVTEVLHHDLSDA
jgi:hypothetical protein